MLLIKSGDVELTRTTNIGTNNPDQAYEAALEAASFYSGALRTTEFSPVPDEAHTAISEQVLSDESRLTVSKINSWYRSLDTPGDPGCSVEDFLSAHSLVYEANMAGDELDADSFVYRADFNDDIDISRQIPNKALYLQGCLLHEAALITADTDEQEQLMLQARNAYVRAVWPDSQLATAHLQEAVRHIYDIDFKFLANRFRAVFTSDSFNDEEALFLLEQYETLQRNYVDEFLYWCGSNLDGQEKSHTGILFEWVTVLAYRHKIWRDFAFADKEIRLALPREDQPITGRKRCRKQPNKAIDAVITRHFPGGGTEAEFLQCKISRKSSSQEYLPEITMTKAVKSLSLRKIINSNKGEQRMRALQRSFMEAAVAIAREYEDMATNQEEAVITDLQGIISQDSQAA